MVGLVVLRRKNFRHQPLLMCLVWLLCPGPPRRLAETEAKRYVVVKQESWVRVVVLCLRHVSSGLLQWKRPQGPLAALLVVAKVKLWWEW